MASTPTCSEDLTPLRPGKMYPRCEGMGFLWLCVSSLIVMPLLVSFIFLLVMPSEEVWMHLSDAEGAEPEYSYSMLQFSTLILSFFFSLFFYSPWLLVAYGLGLLCSRFWLRALWVVLLVACGALLLVFLLWQPVSFSRTVGPAVLLLAPVMLIIYELVASLSYLLPYWLTCKKAARRAQALPDESALPPTE